MKQIFMTIACLLLVGSSILFIEPVSGKSFATATHLRRTGSRRGWCQQRSTEGNYDLNGDCELTEKGVGCFTAICLNGAQKLLIEGTNHETLYKIYRSSKFVGGLITVSQKAQLTLLYVQLSDGIHYNFGGAITILGGF